MNPTELELAWWRIIGAAREAVLDAIRKLALAQSDERMFRDTLDQTEKKKEKKAEQGVDTGAIGE